ncbi:MAG TPA: UvrB/UvrC motif-containing protein, partial [Gaiellaceae bacterium]|nr:UvrB/UvrC motif-containing protein [Gaiellaceae bacterium]
RVHAKRELAFGAPQTPGVYLFHDARDQVLYVGRARDLRARLRSYFRSDRQRPAVEAALGALHRIEWRETGSELVAGLEELRLIRELRPPANARAVRPDRYVYLRRRGDTVVCSQTPSPFGPIRSRKRAHLAARALQSAEWEQPADALPKLRVKLKRLAHELRFEDAARLRDRIEALEDVVRDLAELERLRRIEAVLVVDKRAVWVAKGQVVCVRPWGGSSGVEWQAGLAAVARAEPTFAPEAADELALVAATLRRPPPELKVVPLGEWRSANAHSATAGASWSSTA